MQYTPEQAAAISIQDRNLIVTAGAGSGKTRVLVDRFVALLESNPDWPLPSLVAVTFTEKAAREMRDRVRQSIEERIVRASDAGDTEAILRWRRHQASLDGARIGTIHSLCATILRSNAAVAGVDPAFEVLDEAQSRLLRDQAIDLALSGLGEAGDSDDFQTFFAEYDIREIRTVLENTFGLAEEIVKGMQASAEQHFAHWQVLHDNYLDQAIDDLRRDQDFRAALTWQPLDGWPPASDKLMQMWQIALDARDPLFDSEAVSEIVAALTRCMDIKLNVGAAGPWGGRDGLAESKRLLRLIRERVEAILSGLGAGLDPAEDGPDARSARLLAVWGNVIAATREAYRDLKARRRVLDFDDLEALACSLLQQPDIAARYCGTEFLHILVDEFQDTNAAQRDILYALSGLERPGSLFVVGDPKQSIYQFRGADVSVFEKVRREILESGGSEILLNTSFRTHDQLVSGFNEVFSSLLTRGSGPMRDYEVEFGKPMEAARVAPRDLGPCVELTILDRANADKDDNDAEAMRRWEATALAMRLRELVESGYPVWDKGAGQYRPMDYGDAAVLFRARKSMALVEDAFKAAQIPFVTIAGQGYYQRSEVWDLVNLLRAVYNIADDLSLAAALRSPLYNLSDEDLLALRLQYDEAITDGERTRTRLPLWTALTSPNRVLDPSPPNLARVAFARDSVIRLRGVAGRVTIAELLTRIIEETSYTATIAGLADGPRRAGNVEKLLELARRNAALSLGDFTAYLQDLTDQEVREGESVVATEGAVQLMTIHASKGLEFPLVALFDSSTSRSERASTLIVDPVVGPACKVRDETSDPPKYVAPFAMHLASAYAKQRSEAEHLRLLYVGMTRAQDYLVMGGSTGSRSSGDKSLLARVAAIFESDLESRQAQDAGAPDRLDRTVIERPWGQCIINRPSAVTSLDMRDHRTGARSGWEMLRKTQPGKDNSTQRSPLPLLAAVERDPQSAGRVLKATELAKLADAKAIPDLKKFRHHILRGAPAEVYEVANPDVTPRVTKRIIGNIVHQALRWLRLPATTPNLRDALKSYAWEQGVSNAEALENAVDEAYRLLERTEQHDLIRQITTASQIYQELPFALKWGDRTINGVIDVLFFSKYQRWTLVDYKTSWVASKPDDPQHTLGERLADHARRYFGQIGIYAIAVENLTGQPPDANLFYVRHARSVEVRPEDWRATLATLDLDITTALAEPGE